MLSPYPVLVKGELRITRSLLNAVQSDLMRPHEFAHERVGFLYGRYHIGPDAGYEPLILFRDYQSVPDDRYLTSREFGALIGRDVILSVMQRLRDKQGMGECGFHVHIHDHRGQPRLSAPDRRSLPHLIPGFQRVEPSGCHGILILSRDNGTAWAWLPGESEPVTVQTIMVAGNAPLSLFRYKEISWSEEQEELDEQGQI